MPSFIFDTPFKRYTKKRTLLKTKHMLKLLVVRKNHPDEQFILNVAPTNIDGEPNHVMQAVRNLLPLSHPNVLHLYEAYLHDDYCFWVEQDWSSSSPKRNGISGCYLTEDHVANIIKELVCTIRFLHLHDIIHGNLSANDVKFYRDENLYVNFKICDLGVDRHVVLDRGHKGFWGLMGRHSLPKQGGNVASLTPPETAKGMFGAAGDIWFIGSVAYRLLTGNIQRGHDLVQIERSLVVKDISTSGIDFVMWCLKMDPYDRPSTGLLLQHQWLDFDNDIANNPSISDSSKLLTCLSKVDINDQFQRICCLIISRLVSDDDKLPFRLLYEGIDVNRNGYISKDEFVRALTNCTDDMANDLAEAHFDYLDFSCKNKISFCDFTSAMMQFVSDIPPQKLKAAFHLLDFDGDGEISAGDLSKTANITYNYAVEQIDKILEKESTGNSKNISEEHFLQLMTSDNMNALFRRDSWSISSKSLFYSAESQKHESIAGEPQPHPVFLRQVTHIDDS